MFSEKALSTKIGGFNTSIDFYGEDTDIACRIREVGDVKFSFSFPIYSSGRRLAKEGILKTGCRYALNYLLDNLFSQALYRDINGYKIKSSSKIILKGHASLIVAAISRVP